MVTPSSARALFADSLQKAIPLQRPKSIDNDKAEISSLKSTRESAQQFEGILIRQLLKPLEESLSGSMGGKGSSPMVGGMIISGLSQSIIDGGGLGLASVVEEALRDPPAQQVSSREGLQTQLEPLAQVVRDTKIRK